MTGDEQLIIDAAAKTGYAAEAAEKAIIGSIVLSYDRCAHVVSELTEEDFYFAAHKAAFKAVKLAKSEGLSVDLVTVDQEIQKLDPINASAIADMIEQSRGVEV